MRIAARSDPVPILKSVRSFIEVLADVREDAFRNVDCRGPIRFEECIAVLRPRCRIIDSSDGIRPPLVCRAAADAPIAVSKL